VKRESLFAILGHLAAHRRKLVLMQDRKYWRIEDLYGQAARDAKSQQFRDAVLDPAYTVGEEGGKVVIRRGGDAIFYEPGWQKA
jgi:hypothetical protein